MLLFFPSSSPLNAILNLFINRHMRRNNYFSIFLFRMELSLRVVASSLAVCLFITTVANEHIRLKDESRMLRIIK